MTTLPRKVRGERHDEKSVRIIVVSRPGADEFDQDVPVREDYGSEDKPKCRDVLLSFGELQRQLSQV